MIDSKITWHLDNWSEWLRDAGGSGSGSGYSSRSSMGGQSGSRDFDAMVQSEDNRCAKAVDAIVGGLPDVERVAVNHYHVAAVFRVHVDPDISKRLLNDRYLSARVKVGAELDRRGIL